MQQQSPLHSVLVKEKKRMFLVEKQSLQPEKSVFNIGDARHNRQECFEGTNRVPIAMHPSRFIQWNENKNS
jgi:hypothetical protein